MTRQPLPAVSSVLASPLIRRSKGLGTRLRWHLNTQLVRRPWLLNAAGAQLTVVDAFGTPGDTLLTATVCRHLRQWYPRLRINCLTPNPDLPLHDPNIDTVNQPETFFSVWSWYPELRGRRDTANVLTPTFARLGCEHATFEYRSRVFLTAEERTRGRALIGDPSKPVLTFHIRTREEVKEWPVARWHETLSRLQSRFQLVHLGDDREPVVDGAQRFAGKLTMRESMSVLAHANLHLGADSFLMHAANGLDIPAVIIFGGSRPAVSLGYEANANLFTPMPCGPCWLQSSQGERCEYNLACMDPITPDAVIAAIDRLSARQ